MSVFLSLALLSSVQFGAQTLVYEPDSHRVWLFDSARVITENTLLYADTVLYEDSLKRLQAWGNPVLIFRDRGDTLRGDYLVYRLDTRQGMATRGRSFLQKGWLSGEEMYRLSENEILVRNGTFTTCSLRTPHYYFASRTVKAIQNNLAIVRPLWFYIRGIPVFYLPFWMFPIARGRKSGFLTPRFGLNSVDGRYIRNLAYYWAASPYWDVTLTLNLFERQKIQVAMDIPYRRYRIFEGHWQASAAQEFQTGTTRYSLEGYHTHIFSSRSKLTLRLQFLSDEQYIRDYSETREEFLKTSVYSYATYAYSHPLFGFRAQASRFQDLARNTLQENLPSLSWSLPALRVGGLTFSTSGRADRMTVESPDTAWTRWGARQDGGLSFPFRVLRYIQVSPSLQGYALVMDRDTAGHLATYATYSGGVALSTVLYGYSLFSLGPVERFRHTLRPSIQASWAPRNPGQHLVPFGSYGPTEGGTWSASWQVSNLFEGKTARGVIQLGRLSIAQSYNPQLPPEERFSDYGVSFEVLPGNRRLNVRGSAVLAHPDFTLKTLTLDWRTDFALQYPMVWTAHEDSASGKVVYDPAKWRLGVALSFRKTRGLPASQFLDLSLSGNPTRLWRISLTTGYDLGQGKWLARRLSVTRDLHCWEMAFSWTTQGDYWAYDFRLWIRSLPDVKIHRGLFDMFLP